MIAIVCGGRNYDDAVQLDGWLRMLVTTHDITRIVTGAARGADTLATKWAYNNGLQLHTYPAEWNKHGKAAGALRNQQMLDEAKPHLVIAFPGGAGTSDMMRRARAAGVLVVTAGGNL